MPESQQPREGQEKMIALIRALDPQRVLDVGAGSGKWVRLLRNEIPLARIAALEVWKPYITEHQLERKYDLVMNTDAREFEGWNRFDVIILGDVLEHMDRADALKLVQRLRQSTANVFITLPITHCVQDGHVLGNPFETHRDQWSGSQMAENGWRQIHEGPNENGRVIIGTYLLRKDVVGITVEGAQFGWKAPEASILRFVPHVVYAGLDHTVGQAADWAAKWLNLPPSAKHSLKDGSSYFSRDQELQEIATMLDPDVVLHLVERI